jgi:hypothetical protein
MSSGKLAHLTTSPKEHHDPAPDFSIHMPTYTDGRQFSELTERRAGQTKPLFDLSTEATVRESIKK